MLTEQLARALIERLDMVIAWLTKLVDQGDVRDQSGLIQQQGRTQSLLDLFASLALPCSPELTREVTINAVTPTLIYRNDSLPFARIDVTNDDPAQFMYTGKRNVSVRIGRVQVAQTTEPFIIPQGDELWAICVVATLSCRVSEAYDLVGMAQIYAAGQ
jgi:hypothetical protein